MFRILLFFQYYFGTIKWGSSSAHCSVYAKRVHSPTQHRALTKSSSSMVLAPGPVQTPHSGRHLTKPIKWHAAVLNGLTQIAFAQRSASQLITKSLCVCVCGACVYSRSLAVLCSIFIFCALRLLSAAAACLLLSVLPLLMELLLSQCKNTERSKIDSFFFKLWRHSAVANANYYLVIGPIDL